MMGVKDIESLVRNLNIRTSVDMDERVFTAGLAAYEKSVEKRSVLIKPNVYTVILKSKVTRLTAAVVIIIIVLGGISFWPSGGSKNGRWWLGPPAAWARLWAN